MAARKPSPYVRQSEAARVLGINRASIHYHIARGTLTVAEVGGMRFITRRSLTRLVRTRKEAK